MQPAGPRFFVHRVHERSSPFDELPRNARVVSADEVLRGEGLDNVQKKLEKICGVADPNAPRALIVTQSDTRSGNDALIFLARRPEFVVVHRSTLETVSTRQLASQLKDRPRGHQSYRVTFPDQTLESLFAWGKAGRQARCTLSAGAALRMTEWNPFEEPESLTVETRCVGTDVEVKMELRPQRWLQKAMAQFGMRSDFKVHREGSIQIGGKTRSEREYARDLVAARQPEAVSRVAAQFVQRAWESTNVCPDLEMLHRSFFIAEFRLMDELMAAFDQGGHPAVTRSYETILRADRRLVDRLEDRVIRTYPSTQAWRADEWAELT